MQNLCKKIIMKPLFTHLFFIKKKHLTFINSYPNSRLSVIVNFYISSAPSRS